MLLSEICNLSEINFNGGNRLTGRRRTKSYSNYKSSMKNWKPNQKKKTEDTGDWDDKARRN